jgi:5-formyltetrahydrofolate cyclo-ligase
LLWRVATHADIVDDVPTGTKAQRRAELLAVRRALPDWVRHAEAAALCEHARDVAQPGDIVCAYMPVGAEPGSAALVDRLRQLCGRLLLPVTRTGADGEPEALWWGEYGGQPLVAGRYGLLEPAGPGLPPETLAQASVILVPALAVDRRGVRLGRGGGYYDRSLPLCRPGARLVAVVRDCEVVDELPSEPHDVRMTHALTPGMGLIALGAGN